MRIVLLWATWAHVYMDIFVNMSLIDIAHWAFKKRWMYDTLRWF